MGLFGKLFGSKKEVLEPVDLSFISVDMHSHLIPGIDDGAATMDDSMVMLAKFESLGYKKVITTPHIMSDYFKNTPDIILNGLESVRNNAKTIGLSIEIDAAAEYYFDDAFMERLKRKDEILTFGDNYVLFEYSFHSKPSYTNELIFELLTQNYQPVLAHFERYMYYLGNIDEAVKLREAGVKIQMNINSLFGHYGPDIQKQARLMVDSGIVDFVGTDCHRIDHLMTLEANRVDPYFHKLSNLNLLNHSLLNE